MKQILQNLSSGETLLAEVPAPKVRAGHILIETEASLVSLGTERMLIDFGKANWLQKARQQPEKVMQVLQKIKSDGLGPTLDVVRARLDTPLSLGYCNVGRVIDVGPRVDSFEPGDRVLSNSSHAEIVCAPKNLCAKVPDGVAPTAAAFAVVGAIGLQGIRLLVPTLGETMVVTGLGLIGQLSVQILRAHGCRVIGIDMDPNKCRLAASFGADIIDLSTQADPVKVAESLTGGRGVDGVLITASTKSDAPVHQAAQMCRKRGRIVLVGVVGLKLNRNDFFDKELSFQVSCAYGPGRYDPEYEDKGNDYPFGYVRWTEQRNFEAVLGLMADGSIKTESLTTHRFPFSEALQAYGNVSSAGAMGIVLEYTDTHRPQKDKLERVVRVNKSVATASGEAPTVGVIGAGSFTSLVILPALARTGSRLQAIASSAGVSSAHLAKKFRFECAVSDNAHIFDDPKIDTVFITTRHNSHGALVLRALEAGKHVFVEKPLTIFPQELDQIQEFYRLHPTDDGHGKPMLMVGFNRRFSPLVQKMKTLCAHRTEPLSMIFHVNAGIVPKEHWSQSREEGGGRILGEGCHFIDTLRYLAGSPIERVEAVYARKGGQKISDIASLNLCFADGSIGTVHYFGNGNKALHREQIDLYCGGGILRMENFRTLSGYQWPGFRKLKLRRQDKGHSAEVAAFIDAIQTGGAAPVPLEDIFEVTRASFQADAL